MAIQDLLLLTVINTGICLCLPKMLSIFGSISNRQSQKLSSQPTYQELPELSQPNAYPELASLAR